MPQNRIYRAWFNSFLVAFVFFGAAPFVSLGLWMVTGLILFGWGLAVAVNWRGVADAWPKTRGRGAYAVTVREPMVRLVQGCFALFGAGLFIVGIVNLAR